MQRLIYVLSRGCNMTGNSASSYFLFSSNKSQTATRQSERTLTGPLAHSLSLFFHQRPLYIILTSVMKSEAVQSSHISHSFWCWTSICLWANLLWQGGKHQRSSLLQLQLQSAGSLHVAFRNLRESRSRGWAVVGHQGKTRGHFLCKIWPGFTKKLT